MKTIAVLAVLAALAAVATPVRADNYAVLICGSQGYMNYRHHADVCHAYQILTKHGMPAENIIVFLYDNVANDPQNPYPGQLFNAPTDATTPGVDVYAGCKKDYTGDDVTAANVMSVLTGNSQAVSGVGTGRVLNTTSEDNVFINFVDHGATGLVAMPSGPYWYADDLMKTLKTMNTQNMYKQLTFYMEACESGSMFAGLPAGSPLNIYATTAANGQESSWGTYCPPDDSVEGKSLNSCLGDLYSVNWMQNSDSANFNKETLEKQYTVTKQLTNKSHVMQFGDMSWAKTDTLNDFQGDPSFVEIIVGKPVVAVDPEVARRSARDSRDASLLSLEAQFAAATDPAARAKLGQMVQDEVASQLKADRVFPAIAERFFGDDKEDALTVAQPQTFWDCYRALNDAVEARCGKYTDYSLKYAKVASNMCVKANGSTAEAISHINAVCSA